MAACLAPCGGRCLTGCPRASIEIRRRFRTDRNHLVVTPLTCWPSLYIVDTTGFICCDYCGTWRSATAGPVAETLNSAKIEQDRTPFQLEQPSTTHVSTLIALRMTRLHPTLQLLPTGGSTPSIHRDALCRNNDAILMLLTT
jgi:hypothetical protein